MESSGFSLTIPSDMLFPGHSSSPPFEADNTSGSASVASFEYGINNAIPHSKGGELLCPGNNITEGIVNLNQIPLNSTNFGTNFIAYVGLNNGNGRGSMDSMFADNICLANSSFCD